MKQIGGNTLVLVYECLFGKGVKGGGLRKIISQHEASLRKALSSLLVERGVSDVSYLLPCNDSIRNVHTWNLK